MKGGKGDEGRKREKREKRSNIQKGVSQSSLFNEDLICP